MIFSKIWLSLARFRSQRFHMDKHVDSFVLPVKDISTIEVRDAIF